MAVPSSKRKDEMLNLVHKHASLLGYYEGKIVIDPAKDELSSVYGSNCTITTHAPLFGTKAGEEKPVLISDLRKKLAGMLKYVILERHDMHLAVNEKDKTLCLNFLAKAKLKFMPCCYMMKVPLCFVFVFSSSKDGELRISDIHEWPADSPESAQTLLTEKLGWPTETKFEKYEQKFGALS